MATQITEQIVREAPQIEAYKLGLLESAKNLSQQPLALPAYQTAGLSEYQQAAMNLAPQGIGAYAPFLQAGQTAVEQGIGATGVATQRAADVNVAPQFQQAQQALQYAMGQSAGPALGYQPGMEQPFMNPYQQAVTQQALAEMQRQGAIARQGQAAQAIGAGAFGGTREGVQRAEFDTRLQDLMAQRVFQDYAQNYGQAQQAAMTGFEQQQQRDLARTNLLGQLGQTYGSLAGQQGQLGLQQAGMLGQMGQQYGQLGVQQAALGEAAQRMGTQDLNTLLGLGSLQQQTTQAGLEAARATQLQQAMTPYQQTAFLSDIMKNAPSTQMSLTGATAPTTSPLLQAAGLGVSALSAAAGAQKAGLF
jgi:hypothetical protein